MCISTWRAIPSAPRAAVVKLVHAEPESAALRSWLDERADIQWISSVLTEIESFRALARYAPEAISRLPAVLDQIDLIDLDQRIRMLAQTVTPATVRSLDAIHLGTALHDPPRHADLAGVGVQDRVRARFGHRHQEVAGHLGGKRFALGEASDELADLEQGRGVCAKRPGDGRHGSTGSFRRVRRR